MKRIVEPEILDSLPHTHPDALESRGDIRFLNSLMGSFAWVRQQLSRHADPGERIAELGAGDAGLIRYIAGRHPALANQWTGLDLAPPPPDGLPAGARWVQGDFFAQQEAGRVLQQSQVIVANLILHHFQDDQLVALSRQFKSARVLIISEPARHTIHHWKGRLVDAILGFNYVTMYDMGCSIRAGFRTGELPGLLGLDPTAWDIWESHSFFGACRLLAVRRG